MGTQQLWKFEDFASRMPGATYRTLVRLSVNGGFPPGIRITPGSRMVWPKAAVLEHLNRMWAALEPLATPA